MALTRFVPSARAAAKLHLTLNWRLAPEHGAKSRHQTEAAGRAPVVASTAAEHIGSICRATRLAIRTASQLHFPCQRTPTSQALLRCRSRADTLTGQRESCSDITAVKSTQKVPLTVSSIVHNWTEVTNKRVLGSEHWTLDPWTVLALLRGVPPVWMDSL